jgi:hypothetical protein
VHHLQVLLYNNTLGVILPALIYRCSVVGIAEDRAMWSFAILVLIYSVEADAGLSSIQEVETA